VALVRTALTFVRTFSHPRFASSLFDRLVDVVHVALVLVRRAAANVFARSTPLSSAMVRLFIRSFVRGIVPSRPSHRVPSRGGIVPPFQRVSHANQS
jgi:hypothetical protein